MIAVYCVHIEVETDYELLRPLDRGLSFLWHIIIRYSIYIYYDYDYYYVMYIKRNKAFVGDPPPLCTLYKYSLSFADISSSEKKLSLFLLALAR